MKKFFIALLAVSILVAVIIFFSAWKMKRDAVASYNRYITNAPYDVIIVPGLPYDTGKQNILLKVRMLWAKSLFDKGITRNIIFSGAAVHTAWVEGKVMKIMADSMGIPAGNTFAEDKAEHGNENVYYGCKLAQKLGFKKIALATDQYQNAYLSSFILKKESNIALLPVTIDSFPAYDKKRLPVINANEAHQDNFIPLDKRQTRYQRFRRSFTSNVKESE